MREEDSPFYIQGGTADYDACIAQGEHELKYVVFITFWAFYLLQNHFSGTWIK